jgi:hypothetical protein
MGYYTCVYFCKKYFCYDIIFRVVVGIGEMDLNIWSERSFFFHHHRHINGPTAGAQALHGLHIRRTGHNPPRGPNAGW